MHLSVNKPFNSEILWFSLDQNVLVDQLLKYPQTQHCRVSVGIYSMSLFINSLKDTSGSSALW